MLAWVVLVLKHIVRPISLASKVAAAIIWFRGLPTLLVAQLVCSMSLQRLLATVLPGPSRPALDG
jgi:hypothetical protein